MEAIAAYIKEVLDALDITYGPAHTEIIWTEGMFIQCMHVCMFFCLYVRIYACMYVCMMYVCISM